MKDFVEPVSAAEIAEAFAGTNFGVEPSEHEHLLAMSVMKKALGYHCGWTITRIMQRMGLVSGDKNEPTDRGRLFCYDFFNLKRSG